MPREHSAPFLLQDLIHLHPRCAVDDGEWNIGIVAEAPQKVTLGEWVIQNKYICWESS